jgi:hypothetical protein
MEKVIKKLKEKSNVCSGALEYMQQFEDGQEQEAWEQCPDGAWMLWFLKKPGYNNKGLVWLACQCARLALIHVPAGEERPRIAIETAERWTRGEATDAELEKAKCNAHAAVHAVAYAVAAVHAADAAYAAANAAARAAAAARVAVYDAAYAAAYAACIATAAYAAASAAAVSAASAAAVSSAAAASAAAADAAHAVSSAAAASADAAYAAGNAAERAVLRQCADIVRKEIPNIAEHLKGWLEG